MHKSLALILCSLLILSSCSVDWNDEKEKKISENRNKSSSTIKNDTVCKLNLSTTVSINTQNKNQVEADSSYSKNDLIIKLHNLDSENPSLEGNGGKTSLKKISNGGSLYLIEETGVGNIVVWTLFKDSGILIMSKQYDLLGAFGTQMIGFCE